MATAPLSAISATGTVTGNVLPTATPATTPVTGSATGAAIPTTPAVIPPVVQSPTLANNTPQLTVNKVQAPISKPMGSVSAPAPTAPAPAKTAVSPPAMSATPSVTGTAPQKAPAPVAPVSQSYTNTMNPTGVSTAQGSKVRAQQVTSQLAKPADVQKPITIDPLSPTAVNDVQKAALAAKSNRSLQEQDAKADAMLDQYLQQMGEQGIKGGSRNAFLGALFRENSSQRSDLLFALQQEELKMAAEKQDTEQESFMSQFNLLVGNGRVDDSILFAQEMAKQYPDSTFWNYYAYNPNAKTSLAASMSPAARKAAQEAQVFARDQVNMNVTDFYDKGQTEGAWPTFLENWKKTYTGDTELQLAATTWAKSSPEDAATAIEELTGMTGVDVNSLPADVVAKAYIRDYYDKYVKGQQASNYSRDALELANSFTTDPAELERLQDAAVTLASTTPRNISIDGITVQPEAFTDTQNGALSYLFTDWQGNDYDPATNPRNSVPGTESYALDQLWKAALGVMDENGESILAGVTRDQFRDIATGMNGELIASGNMTEGMAKNLAKNYKTALASAAAQNTNDPGVIAKNELANKTANGQPLTLDDAPLLAQAILGMDDMQRQNYLVQLQLSGAIPKNPPVPLTPGFPFSALRTANLPQLGVFDGELVIFNGSTAKGNDGNNVVQMTASTPNGAPIYTWESASPTPADLQGGMTVQQNANNAASSVAPILSLGM